MIGLDAADISRIEKILNGSERDAFLGRLLNPSELRYVTEKGFAPETVAGIFCAKEATLKAVGTGIGNGAALKDVEVVYSPLGQPSARLYGGAAEAAGGKTVQLSISHDGGIAVAVALLV